MIGLGFSLLALGVWAFDADRIGALCADDWISDSTGPGTCSGHGGIREDRVVDTFLSTRPVGWIGVTRWPLLGTGLLAAAVGIGALREHRRRLIKAKTLEANLDDYLDLHVQVAADTAGRTVTATAASGMRSSANFSFDDLTDRGATRLTELLTTRSTRRLASNQARAVETLGNDLFAALFPGGVERVYRAAVDDARRNDVGLRVVLELDEATSDLPWEYLHDKKRSSFLALSSETSVVRLVEVSDETRRQSRVEIVRILVMGSNPRGAAKLDLVGEQERIHSELAAARRAGLVDLQIVPGGTLEDLRGQLEAFRPHIFHFSGHGRWDGDADDGELLFETRTGSLRSVTGRELGVLLVRSELRLVILNSCEAARSSQEDKFAGVAPSLVAQGVPAALAMQYPIEDCIASAFGSTFLQNLVESKSIDRALTEARQSVFALQERVEWGTPVFTSRVPIPQVLPLVQAAPT